MSFTPLKYKFMAREYMGNRFLTKAIAQSKEEINAMKHYRKVSFILIILYGVGIISLILNLHPLFIYLTPLNLLISFALVMYAHPKWEWRIILVLLISFSVGMAVEIIGVATGDIFGAYEYGDVLGPKIEGTPYAIGWNWMMLIYCTGAVVNRITYFKEHKLWHIFLKSFLGGLLLLSLDVLIEPVAIMQGFWSWGGDGNIPTQNYVAWFIISFFLLFIFNFLLKDLRNKAAFTLLILQFLFFFFLGLKW